MLVICEECAKKYNIDENRIKGDRARFSCLECGHIIVVEKPRSHSSGDAAGEELAMTMAGQDMADDPSADDSRAATGGRKDAGRQGARSGKRGRGVPIGLYLLVALTIGFLTITGVMAYLYLRYIPELMNHQVDLRTTDIAISFGGSVKQPLLVRNYLLVNKEAERISRLPGVAYAAVVNKRGIVVAGFFSDLSRFSPDFARQVKEKGFPQVIVRQNHLAAGSREKDHVFTLGGQKLHDKAIALPDVGGEVHVGIYISDVDRSIRKVLLSPTTFSLLGLVLFSGILTFFLIARSISRPLQELTEVVNRISLGELDLAVEPRGPREVRELASAFERMQYSIKAALERMRRSS